MKKTIRYKRLLPDISIALLRDEATNKLIWRHRFKILKKAQVNKVGTQDFKDYPHKKFKTLGDFEEFIEKQDV